MSDDWSKLADLGKTIQGQEWDSAFSLDAFGNVTPTEDIWVPEILHSDVPGVDVEIMGPWSAMTGLTGQYSYNGAVMHPSEYIGSGVAGAMLSLVRESGKPFLTFAITEVRESSGEHGEDPVGWAILYRDES